MDTIVSGVGVLDKAVLIMGALEPGPLSLAELVESTGISRPTAHRLAVALEDHGLVRRDEEGRFTLGLRLVALGHAAEEANPLAEAAGPALRRLRDETGESVQLYVRRDDHRVCIVSMESPHGLRTIVPLGAVLPLDRGSAGAVLRGDEESARKGWAQSVGEREAGVASVSAPVCDLDGAIIAAVGISGPIERVSRSPGRRYGNAVIRAARAIEAAHRGAGGQRHGTSR